LQASLPELPENKKSRRNDGTFFFDHQVDFTDQISNSIIEELQILSALKNYLANT
jgi:hypothetical protein